MEPVLEEVGFDEDPSDSHLLILNRNQIIGAACRLLIPECVQNATSLYRKWMEDPDNNQYIVSSLLFIFKNCVRAMYTP